MDTSLIFSRILNNEKKFTCWKKLRVSHFSLTQECFQSFVGRISGLKLEVNTNALTAREFSERDNI